MPYFLSCRIFYQHIVYRFPIGFHNGIQEVAIIFSLRTREGVRYEIGI